MATKEHIMTSNGLNFLAAIWLFASPFILGFSGTSAATNNYIMAVIIGILALIGMSMSSQSMVWPSWLSIIAGLWLIVSPFFLAAVTTGALWNNIILGIAVAALGAWGSTTEAHHHMTDMRA